mgnify:CR=1 FL=1
MYYSLYKDIKGLIAEKFGILLDPVSFPMLRTAG